MKRPKELAPIFFAISFILTIFLHNIGELSLRMIIAPLLIIILFSAVFLMVFIFLFQNRQKATIAASIFIILFFSYGEVFTLLGKNWLILPLWLLAIFFSFFLIKKTGKNLSSVSRFLMLVSVMATLLPLWGIGRFEIAKRLSPQVKSMLELPDADKAALNKDNLPDIYYILPDSYSSPLALKDYFQYDDSSFVSHLENKGFYVAAQATSNYPKTFLSLASTLNMEYLGYLSSFKNSSDQTLTTPLIEDSQVLRFLKSLGYNYYQMGSWWEPTHYNPLADENFIFENKNLGDIGEFNYLILTSSMLRPLITKVMPQLVLGDSEADLRARILYQFETLPKVAKEPGPKFVFAHIIAPHGPFIFGRNCEVISEKQRRGKTDEENYTNQVNCINQKLEATIDKILLQSSKPPVILIQADEGAPFLSGRVNPQDSWGKASPDLLNKKFPILAAYYLPGVSKQMLYSSITPVNSFRVIFNLYFKTGLPILPDQNYIFPDTENYYDFKDVTAEVKTQ